MLTRMEYGSTARALPSRSRDLSPFDQNGCAAERPTAAPPFRSLGRRSGRIPAEPYPPPRCCQYKSASAKVTKKICWHRRQQGINTLVLPHSVGRF